MFVAEAKFNDLKLHNEYIRLIQLQDSDGLLQLLTNEQVEEKLLVRLKKKATIYGREIDLTGDADGGDVRLEPETICSIYKQFVIPLTKEVEVAYLLRRLDEDFKPEIEYK